MTASLAGGERPRERASPGTLAPGLVTYDSNQRAGNGSGVVVMSARCMPVTIAPGLRPPHPGFPASPAIGALVRPAGGVRRHAGQQGIVVGGFRLGADDPVEALGVLADQDPPGSAST